MLVLTCSSFAGSNWYPFPVINVTMSIVVFCEFCLSSKLSKLKVIWGNS